MSKGGDDVIDVLDGINLMIVCSKCDDLVLSCMMMLMGRRNQVWFCEGVAAGGRNNGFGAVEGLRHVGWGLIHTG